MRQAAMARPLGPEFFVLLLLGFSVGALLFMYLNIKNELHQIERENHALQKKVMESVSSSKTTLYKKNLIEEDLKKMREESKHGNGRIEILLRQLQEKETQILRYKDDLSKAIRNQSKLTMEKEERQGIEDDLADRMTDIQEKLKKCEQKKAATLKAVGFANAKKLKSLQEAKVAAENTLAEEKKKIERLQERADVCDNLNQDDPPAKI